jgi:hypothetical protein
MRGFALKAKSEERRDWPELEKAKIRDKVDRIVPLFAMSR